VLSDQEADRSVSRSLLLFIWVKLMSCEADFFVRLLMKKKQT